MDKFVLISATIALSSGLFLGSGASGQTDLKSAPKSVPINPPEIELEPKSRVEPLSAPKAATKSQKKFELAKDLDGLFHQLKRTGNSKRASRIAEAIWEKWRTSDSRSVDLLTGWARTATNKRNFGPALDLLDQVIVLRPQYAEGYNQRATLHYMMENYGKSIVDIENTLALEPRHFGALSGLGIILERVDKKKDALTAWTRALEVYPAMKSAQDAVIRLEEELAGSNI